MVEIADDLYDPDGRFAAFARIDSIREESITLESSWLATSSTGAKATVSTLPRQIARRRHSR